MFRKGFVSVAFISMALCGCRSWGQFWLTGFTYPVSPLILTQNVAMTATIPTLPGSPRSCTASPALPAGLSLDQTTCAISGTPTRGTGRTVYRITADLGADTISGEIIIRVLFQPRFVYTSNANDNTISRFTIQADGSLNTKVDLVTATAPRYVWPSPDHKFLYVANTSAGQISVYEINQTSGALTQIANSPFATSASPYSLSFSPDGTRLYVGHDNVTVQGVTAHAVNTSTGALTQLNGGTPYIVAAGSSPAAVAAEPGGRHLYVGSTQSTLNAHAFAVSEATGALTQLAGSPYITINNAISVAVHPTGNFVYFAQYSLPANGVMAFRRDSVTGALQHITGPFATGTSPTYVTLSIDGKFAYVTNSASSSFSGFKIDMNTGALAATPNSPNGVLTSPQGAAIDETVKYIYVPSAGSDAISAFSINQTTGEVTVIGNSVAAPYATGDAPVHVAVVGSNP